MADHDGTPIDLWNSSHGSVLPAASEAEGGSLGCQPASRTGRWSVRARPRRRISLTAPWCWGTEPSHLCPNRSLHVHPIRSQPVRGVPQRCRQVGVALPCPGSAWVQVGPSIFKIDGGRDIASPEGSFPSPPAKLIRRAPTAGFTLANTHPRLPYGAADGWSRQCPGQVPNFPRRHGHSLDIAALADLGDRWRFRPSGMNAVSWPIPGAPSAPRLLARLGDRGGSPNLRQRSLRGPCLSSGGTGAGSLTSRSAVGAHGGSALRLAAESRASLPTARSSLARRRTRD